MNTKNNKLSKKLFILSIITLFGVLGTIVPTNKVSAMYVIPECNSATLKGDIQISGGSTMVWFEWGLGSSLNNSTPKQGPFSSNANFSAPISGLTENTTYSVRAMSSNSTGQTLQFKTNTCTQQNKPLILNFSANPTSMTWPENFTTLSWNVTGADSCWATASPQHQFWNSNNPVNGFNNTQPIPNLVKGDNNFTLECRNSAGSVSKTVTVRVNDQVAPQNTLPQGYFDEATCSELKGWAIDFDSPTATLNVKLSDGENSYTTLANTNRQDVGNVYPTAGDWHGFSLSTPNIFKKSFPNTIRAYAIDKQTGEQKELGTSPKTIPACISTPAPTCQTPGATNIGGPLPCQFPNNPPPPPPQTCQDPSATNYGGSLPCRYPAPTCQDPSATNYRGALPCTYPAPTCQDPSATNYRGALPCTYPAPTCQDPNASNYRGALPCTYPGPRCQDPNANNYGSTGTCTYTQRCQDPNATNYGSTGSCTYNTQRCLDTSATNYGSTGTCYYQPAQTCQDPSAINYRGTLPCNYRTTILSTPPPTVSISADSSNIAYNTATTVRWSSTNATSCYAAGGSVGWTGQKSIGPASFYTGLLTSSKVYAISCSGPGGTANASAPVTVRGQITTTVVNRRPASTSYVVINSSIDRNQPIVPTLDNTRPRPGDEINYTITYQNIGTASITNLVLRLDLPYEVDYLFSNPNNPTRTGNTLVFSLGTLRANGQGTVTARVRVRENIPLGTPLNFPAVLTYTDPSGATQTVTANVSAQVWSAPVAPLDPNMFVQPGQQQPVQLGANAFLAGFLPANVFGWLLLLVLILILVLLARYLFAGEGAFSRKTVTTTIQH